MEVKLQILTFIRWFWWKIEWHSCQNTVCGENTDALQMMVYWWLSRWRWSIHFTHQICTNWLA